MDVKAFLKENPDWVAYRCVLDDPPDARWLMLAYCDVNPEVLARCQEVVWEDGWVSRGAIYYRIREEEFNCRGADTWASIMALKDYPPSNAQSEAMSRCVYSEDGSYLD